MAAIATDDRALGKLPGAEVAGVKHAGSLGARKHRTAVVAAMAGAALSRSPAFGGVAVTADPVLSNGMHSMRAAGNCRRLFGMTGRALGKYAAVSLQLDRLHVIAGVRTRILGMGRSVTSLALHTTVSLGEAIEV